MAVSTTSRILYSLILTLICLVFYFAGPYTTQAETRSVAFNADARCAQWLDAVVPRQSVIRSSRDSSLSKPAKLPKAQPLVPFSPFPLGVPSVTTSTRSSHSKDHDFVDSIFRFQEDILNLPIPRHSLMRHKDQGPHNYISGKPRPTFATFLSTRNSSVQDPYFAATLSLVYRLLWDPDISSKTYPVTVFVAPFVNQEQRDLLAGSGAIIRELPLNEWTPGVDGIYSRLRDQFSKLNMWGFTEFSKIAFLDADAFPIKNIDVLFDIAERQECVEKKLTTEDGAYKNEVCDYVFAGVDNVGGKGKIHGGVLVFEPNVRMHQRLLRNYLQTTKYDNVHAEQGFLNWQFSPKGAFPPQILPRRFNAFFPQDTDEDEISVVHAKLWDLGEPLPEWLDPEWDESWMRMMAYYNGPAFSHARKADVASAGPNPSFRAEAAMVVEDGQARAAALNQAAEIRAKQIALQRPDARKVDLPPAQALSEKQQRLLRRQQKKQFPRLDDLV